MLQEVDVINTALGFLGREPVADLSETTLETSVAATKLLRSIEQAREAVLQRHGWLCALSRAVLNQAVLPNYADWKYDLAYLLPGEALRVWEVAGFMVTAGVLPWGEPPWELGTFETQAASQIVIRVNSGSGTLVNSDGTLNVTYVRRANWASLDAHLADAIAAECAWRQAFSILGSAQVEASLERRKESFVQLAIGKDASQAGGQPPLAGSVPRQIRRFAGATSSYWFGPDGQWDWGSSALP